MDQPPLSQPTVNATRVIAGVLTVIAIALHLLFFTSVGPLWRDELETVNFARSPSIDWYWERVDASSSTALTYVLLRGWITLAGDSTASLRTFGLMVGLGIVAASWFAVWKVSRVPPLAALALAGAHAALIRYGDAIRGGGLGVAAGLLSAATMFTATRSGTARGYAAAAILAVLSVQIGYYNAFLLFACAIAAALLEYRSRGLRAAWRPLAIGAIAGLTMAPYLQAIAGRTRWQQFETYGVDLAWVTKRFIIAQQVAGPFMLPLFIIAVAAAIFFALKQAAPESVFARTYCIVVLILYTVLHWAFLRNLEYAMQPWYFILYIAIAGFCIDVLIASANTRFASWTRILLAVVFVASSLPWTARALAQRQSNMDLAAGAAARIGRPHDLVVVYPWYCGISFDRYYKGSTPWVTLPPVADHSVHRYDQMMKSVNDPAALTQFTKRVATTLRSGGRIILVGFPLFEESGPSVPRPLNAAGDADYRWCSTFVGTLRENATQFQQPMGPDPSVSFLERVTMTVFWKSGT